MNYDPHDNYPYDPPSATNVLPSETLHGYLMQGWQVTDIHTAYHGAIMYPSTTRYPLESMSTLSKPIQGAVQIREPHLLLKKEGDNRFLLIKLPSSYNDVIAEVGSSQALRDICNDTIRVLNRIRIDSIEAVQKALS